MLENLWSSVGRDESKLTFALIIKWHKGITQHVATAAQTTAASDVLPTSTAVSMPSAMTTRSVSRQHSRTEAAGVASPKNEAISNNALFNSAKKRLEQDVAMKFVTSKEGMILICEEFKSVGKDEFEESMHEAIRDWCNYHEISFTETSTKTFNLVTEDFRGSCKASIEDIMKYFNTYISRSLLIKIFKCRVSYAQEKLAQAKNEQEKKEAQKKIDAIFAIVIYLHKKDTKHSFFRKVSACMQRQKKAFNARVKKCLGRKISVKKA